MTDRFAHLAIASVRADHDNELNILKDIDLVPIEEGMGTATRMQSLARVYINGRVQRREVLPKTGRDNLVVLRKFALTYGNRPVANLSRKDIERWLESGHHLTQGTRRVYLAIVRNFTRWLQQERHLRSDPMIHIRNPRMPRRVPRALHHDDIADLYAALPDNRARAIFALMRGEGLRRSEVVHAQVGDWDRHARTLKVTGKGGHERVIPVTNDVTEALTRYFNEGGIKAGPMIRNRTDPTQGLSTSRLGFLMRRWMTEAGIKTAPWDGKGCHSLRHTIASEVADVEPDLRVVQELLGHASLSSTQIYLRRATLAKVRAAMESAA